MSRIVAFDYLRGFFILVILIDHLWRWPNIFSFVSGEGRLWVTAAEGFVIISGLLVGYIRGYKNQREPWVAVAIKLLKRAGTLYVWGVITTIVLTGAYWLFFLKGSHGAMPYVSLPDNNWLLLIQSTLTLQYAHIWTFFLHLYAIFLVLAVPVVVLLRHQQAWLVALGSLALWWLGVTFKVEWLTWQVLFFLPAVIGFYFEPLRRFFGRQPPKWQQTARWSVITMVGLTIALSAMIEFEWWGLVMMTDWLSPYGFEQLRALAQAWFNPEVRTLAWLAASLLWFAAFCLLFHQVAPWLQRWLRWLLEPFGTRSLTAYILHGVPLIIVLYLFPNSPNIWLNSLLTALCILSTWWLLRLRWLQHIIPS